MLHGAPWPGAPGPSIAAVPPSASVAFGRDATDADLKRLLLDAAAVAALRSLELVDCASLTDAAFEDVYGGEGEGEGEGEAAAARPAVPALTSLAEARE